MSKRSTLIFLVNQIKSEFTGSSQIGSVRNEEEEPAIQESSEIFAPPERSVQAILGFARSLEVADTAAMGKVEWVLN